MQGKITNIIPMLNGKVAVTVEVAALPEDLEELAKKDLDIIFKEWSGPRTLDQNAFMWACLTEMGHALGLDRWDCYILMLKRYGVEAVHLLMDPKAVETFRTLYRTIHILGDRFADGEWKTEVMAFKGSSEMTKKQMSALLDGIESEMREMGLKIPEVER